jgi:hypothetical protein
MSEAIRNFCVAWRELGALQEATRTRTRDSGLTKNAAQTVLKEYMLSMGSSASELGYSSSVNGTTYRCRLKRVKPSAPRVTSASVDEILKIWDDPAGIEARLILEVGLDPASALVSLVMDHLASPSKETLGEDASSSTQNNQEIKWKLDLAPYRSKGDGADAPPSAPAGAPIDELAATLISAMEISSQASKEAKEIRKSLQDKIDIAADQVLPELQALPSEKKVQKVSLKDSNGNTEAYYLRVKPPMKMKFKKIAVSAYKKILKTQAEETISRFCVDAFRAPSMLARREFGEELCASLKKILLEFESVPMTNDSGPRIALDRVRARSSAALR